MSLSSSSGEDVRIAVSDDGTGISDPQLLLSFGQSGWDDRVAADEDPAGMGVLALARFGCRVESRVGSRPYRVEVTPEVLSGEGSAQVVGNDVDGTRFSTRISFTHPATDLRIVTVCLQSAALYFPLPVYLNGQRIEQGDFLEEAVHIEEWSGLRLGVFRGSYNLDPHDINFHGRTVKSGFTAIVAMHAESWSREDEWHIQVDVVACPNLELVLPARKELVHNDFLSELRQHVARVIFRAMAASDPVPDLPWSQWDKARKLGVELPMPAPRLASWKPARPEDHTHIRRVRQALEEDRLSEYLLVSRYLPQSVQHVLERALDNAGLADRVLVADERLAGYSWYDRIARIVDLEGVIENDGEEYPLHEYVREDGANFERRVDRIRFDLSVRPYGEVSEKTQKLSIPGELAFAAADDIEWFDTPMVMTHDCALNESELSELIFKSCFFYNDDSDADSRYTQGEEARQQAWLTATSTLWPKDEHDRSAIIEAVRKHVSYLAWNRNVIIQIQGHYVEVDFIEPNEESARMSVYSITGQDVINAMTMMAQVNAESGAEDAGRVPLPADMSPEERERLFVAVANIARNDTRTDEIYSLVADWVAMALEAQDPGIPSQA